MGSLTVAKIPVIDFTSDDLKPGTSSWVSVCREICSALEEHGCFLAKYNKVSSQLNEAIFDVSEELFHLPTDVKIRNINGFLGYHGQLPARPLYESFAIDYVTAKEQVDKFTNIMWPSGNNHFCQTVYSFSKAVKELHEMVVRMIFDNYGLENKYYDSHIESTTYLLRILKYRAPQENESCMGLHPHTDKSFLTIIHQNHVNGLEVKAKNGEWISVDFAPSTFVVMAGEAIMGWSNDRIDACDHRVTMKYKETRCSLGLFSFIKGIIQVPEELIDEENPLKYKPFDHVGMIHYFFGTAEGRKHQRTLKAYCGL